jgi:hypothetical protein
MTIKEGLKLKGRPADIPDCTRFDLPQFFVEMGYKVGAEIGTSKGVFAEAICKAGLKLYCVDPYLDYEDYYPGDKKLFVKLEDEARKRLAPYDVTFIKKMAIEAVNDIPDGSLDFVYIDGNHEFKYVAEDLWDWSKKVRKGGCISGHDYFRCRPRITDNIHTKYVVDAFTSCMNIKQWYVIGRNEKVEGEKRESVRSFFWIK